MLGGSREYINKQLRRKTSKVYPSYGEKLMRDAKLGVFWAVGLLLAHSREGVPIIQGGIKEM